MNVEDALRLLPADAPEAVVEGNFSKPFLKALGFSESETVPQFPVGSKAVDHAARKNLTNDIFLESRSNPYLYMEVKGRTENLENPHSPSYRKAVQQLKHYLQSPASKSVRWGLLTNSLHIQLFRKHGKVIHPVTPSLPLCKDTQRVIKTIKKTIETGRQALTITIYNNKGGVGKTTTTLNLAAILTLLKKRVLIIDFDPNQSDLGDALGLSPKNTRLLDILRGKPANMQEVIESYRFEHPQLKEPLGFDIILADENLVKEIDETKLSQQVRLQALRKALESTKSSYDYILIDAPPNWRIFSKKAIFAADVVLIPARHDNLHSLENAATAIAHFIPEMQLERQRYGDFGPIALPIFLNNAFRVSEAQLQLMHQAIKKIIKETKHKTGGFDLTRYFYPKYPKGHVDDQMISIPYMAYISRADFMHVPAAFAFKPVREQYLNLVKEYFL